MVGGGGCNNVLNDQKMPHCNAIFSKLIVKCLPFFLGNLTWTRLKLTAVIVLQKMGGKTNLKPEVEFLIHNKYLK